MLRFLLITDIVNNGSMVISIGDKADLVEKAFKVKLEDDMAWLESVVSRKKTGRSIFNGCKPDVKKRMVPILAPSFFNISL